MRTLPLLLVPLLNVLACAAAAAAPFAETSGTPALRVDLGSSTALVYHAKPWQAPNPPPSEMGTPTPQASLGLEFKSVQPQQSARNLLRMQLSGTSNLQFRPRGGGLTVTYRSQF